MPNRANRRSGWVEEDAFQFVADFDKNFPKRKPFSSFRKTQTKSYGHSGGETQQPGLLSGVDDYAPTPPQILNYPEPSSSTKTSTSCLPFPGANAAQSI